MSLNTEGYLMIDHRHADPVPDELVMAMGLPAGAGKGLYETACFTCKHCQAMVVKHPDRTRERAFCRGCEHVICDACGVQKAAGVKCKTMQQKIDEYLESVTN